MTNLALTYRLRIIKNLCHTLPTHGISIHTKHLERLPHTTNHRPADPVIAYRHHHRGSCHFQTHQVSRLTTVTPETTHRQRLTRPPHRYMGQHSICTNLEYLFPPRLRYPQRQHPMSHNNLSRHRNRSNIHNIMFQRYPHNSMPTSNPYPLHLPPPPHSNSHIIIMQHLPRHMIHS